MYTKALYYPLCHTLSNAFLKDMQLWYTFFYISICFSIIYLMFRIYSIVLGILNPACSNNTGSACRIQRFRIILKNLRSNLMCANYRILQSPFQVSFSSMGMIRYVSIDLTIFLSSILQYIYVNLLAMLFSPSFKISLGILLFPGDLSTWIKKIIAY